MSAKDFYYDTVRDALLRDGWAITADPLPLRAESIDDPAADAACLLAAEKSAKQIVVLTKGFLGDSDEDELTLAIGQFVLYRALLRRTKPECDLYIAVPCDVHEEIFRQEIAQSVVSELGIAVVTFDPEESVIAQWLK
jgi:hypothetical protein